MTCPTTSTRWPRASARRVSSSASTPAARTTSTCGRRPRCAASSTACSRSRCSRRACTRARRAASCPPRSELRALLSRVEDERTGEILLRDLHADIPRERIEQARAVSGMLAKRLAEFPFVPGMRPMHDDPLAALLAGTWRPALSITGAAGLPSPTDGGNVLRPLTAAKLSLRLPPPVGAAHAAKRLKETLEAEP